MHFEWIFTKLDDLYSGLHRNVLQVCDLMKLCIDIDKLGDNISFSLKVVVVESRVESRYHARIQRGGGPEIPRDLSEVGSCVDV